MIPGLNLTSEEEKNLRDYFDNWISINTRAHDLALGFTGNLEIYKNTIELFESSQDCGNSSDSCHKYIVTTIEEFEEYKKKIRARGLINMMLRHCSIEEQNRIQTILHPFDERMNKLVACNKDSIKYTDRKSFYSIPPCGIHPNLLRIPGLNIDEETEKKILARFEHLPEYRKTRLLQDGVLGHFGTYLSTIESLENTKDAGSTDPEASEFNDYYTHEDHEYFTDIERRTGVEWYIDIVPPEEAERLQKKLDPLDERLKKLIIINEDFEALKRDDWWRIAKPAGINWEFICPRDLPPRYLKNKKN